MRRLFIGTSITFPEAQQQLKQQLRWALRHDEIVWVQDQITHLTLRFLGKTPEPQIEPLKQELQELCTTHCAFEMNLDKLGVFGSRYCPTVLWLGFSEFAPFRALHEDLEPRLERLGFEPFYGNFVPHITLGRIKRLVDKGKFWGTIEQFTMPEPQPVPIHELTLYQSILRKEGPIYKPLASYPLVQSR